MNLKERIENVENLKEAIICISFGTFVGILTYYIFLYFHIDIYGWNFGLIFAPLAAGYAETILAKRIIGEDIGAISAFILFLVTVVYGFIIANPTLGVNVITFGSSQNRADRRPSPSSARRSTRRHTSDRCPQA